MKALFIGGTGNISYLCSALALEKGWELYLLNRGGVKPEGLIKEAISLVADINNQKQVSKVLEGLKFDVVVDFIAFTEEDVVRDYQLFKNITNQYIYISSASCYQKPVGYPIITESSPLKNPHWQYSRDKIAGEDILHKLYREKDFPMTIVRPSLTYHTVIPVPIGAWKNYNVIDRIKKGKPIIVHGDGLSPWVITHAADFAKGLIGLMGNQQSIGHAFHITTDEVLTWDKIYQTLGMVVGVKPNLIHIASEKICELSQKVGGKDMEGTLLGDKACGVIFDNSKIKTFVPEFKATISFADGIRNTLKWFEESPGRLEVDLEVEKWIDDMIDLYCK
ncbi:NAD-dependent epimerase/dehydratase family protein [Plebeiibacterium sediminum]|uniref:NAD-dependent epimerase/dehydratase family protein n=1 Tax=Plebeiibacterium sediminum TaxID=2992112 RepID=A0AAE3M5Q5_9BACT|nr:NAD-dependent epimerase/dehydratase family protein [Plebeiobacterium sediminum]MCW3787568.1 NAD-dependent epimerase/dehydratase family protein [Plebeiobacterium sediminum]